LEYDPAPNRERRSKHMTATLDDEVAELRRANAELQQRLDEAIAREAATAEVLKESLEYQTATSDVLKGISRSTFDLQPVLGTLVETAARLCCADIAHIATRDGDVYRPKARFAMSLELDAFVKDQTYTPGRGTMTARTLLEKRIVHVGDVATDPEYAQPEAQRLGAFRSVLGVPLMRDEVVIGAIVLGRLRVEPFTDKQIELVTTFADQAVIAIENARLLTETREALEQQTATAEVLQVINSSPGDLTPVFEAMLEKALRLCEASSGLMWSFDGERAYVRASRDVPTEFLDYLKREPPGAGPDTFFGRAIMTRSCVTSADIIADEPYRKRVPLAIAAIELGEIRAVLMAPLVKDNTVFGVFSIFRKEFGPFTDKQIALLQNFAAQAVIAMENARLLTEMREALEQQTATAEVLRVINSSPGDLAPVFDALLEKALRLCEASFGTLLTWDGEYFNRVASRGLSTELVDPIGQRRKPTPGSVAERFVLGENIISISNLIEDDAARSSPALQAIARVGMRSYVSVALRTETQLFGYIAIFRQEVQPFTDKQIALLQNFAAQAVIAMENARLITETREALDQQTATAEVLQVINSSLGDLTPVFDAMLDKATHLCEAENWCSVDLSRRPDERFGDPRRAAAIRRVPLSGTTATKDLSGNKRIDF
jgi:GAF domain-containing protein